MFYRSTDRRIGDSCNCTCSPELTCHELTPIRFLTIVELLARSLERPFRPFQRAKLDGDKCTDAEKGCQGSLSSAHRSQQLTL
jgi:hypothetical protein